MTTPRATDAPRNPRPAPGSPRHYSFPRFERHTLGNGLTVIVAPVTKLPIVTVASLSEAGAVCDPEGKEGVAQLAAGLLTEGTESMDGAELALQFERLGASVESYADWDVASISLTVMSDRLEAALALSTEVMLRPAFSVREVDRLRNERLAALLQMRSEPRGLADETFARVLYDPRSRFSRPDGGTDSSVSSIERDDIVRFHRSRSAPGATTILIVGDVEPDRAVRLVEANLGEWSAPTPPRITARDNAARDIRAAWIVEKADAPQSELRVGQVGLPRSHPDYLSVVVMSAILGGLFNSRINLNLRERNGYTYGAFAGFDWRRQAGPFVVSTAVRSDVTDAAVREILAEVDQILQAPVTPEELSLATSYLDGVFPIRYETTTAIARALAGLVVHELPDDYFDRYRDHVRAVTAESVLEAARRHLDTGRMQIVTVADPSAVRAPLEALGIGPVHVRQPAT